MIKSFSCKYTEELMATGHSKKFPSSIIPKAIRMLVRLQAATNINDLIDPPSNRLHQLVGDRNGQWSISINMKYRVCFKWQDNNASDVEIVDYH